MKTQLGLPGVLQKLIDRYERPSSTDYTSDLLYDCKMQDDFGGDFDSS